ncbi:hypothetical protein [Sphingomonas sp. SRS2]|uniref:hypothetical protein n=1 Tax=Sphingomonas sp. SRS2 TaxID=133190 RepID=UPI0006184284|nr:hypothetical protein [Sphingomonas sp. SRS2]KKC24499.1 hypothetical protein WP12_19065 [Sphingomonas sp. SRS2]
MRKWLLATVGSLAVLSATQLAAAPAQKMSAADRKQGELNHPGLLRDYGGAMSGPAADFATRVGRRVAVQSGLSSDGEDFTVTLLDSTEVIS